jgi:DNA modification methylase
VKATTCWKCEGTGEVPGYPHGPGTMRPNPEPLPCPHCVTPYYRDEKVTLYHADIRDVKVRADVIVTDPPYGIAYKSGRRRATLADSIEGDQDTSLRDWVLGEWDGPALVFGTWRTPRPAGTHTRLIWDTKGALGMGDLSVPWKPSDQEIYVIGKGFEGRRDSNVLTVAPVQAMATNGRLHPHQKPVGLMCKLLEKIPVHWKILDPFAGSGSTLVAAKSMGREAVGVEVDERYCEMAAARLAQEAFDLGEAA